MNNFDKNQWQYDNQEHPCYYDDCGYEDENNTKIDETEDEDELKKKDLWNI